MKIYRKLCLGLVLAIPQMALPKLPFPNGAFGSLEGALDFCARADPQSAGRYLDQKKALVRGASDREVAAARASDEYKAGHASAVEEMGKQPKEQAVKACSAALEANK